MSPLQYQEQLRLQEARRLLMAEIGCGDGWLEDGIREPLAIQPRTRSFVRRTACTRHRPVACRGGGCGPDGRDEAWRKARAGELARRE